jgi:hypothetical protein
MSSQTCRNVESFLGQNWDLKKFQQNCVTCDTPNSTIDIMICQLVKEIKTNLAILDLSETPIEVFLQQSCSKGVINRIQADSFHKFESIPALILPQSENISVTNDNVVAPFCMTVSSRFKVGLVYFLTKISETTISLLLKRDIQIRQQK